MEFLGFAVAQHGVDASRRTAKQLMISRNTLRVQVAR